MRVYYQRKDNSTACFFNKVEVLREYVKLEVQEHIHDDKTEEEENIIIENIVNNIKELKTGEEIKTIGFYWGIREMSEAEFEDLAEFNGW